MPLDGLHEDRERAASFGSAAERYDRYRPGYPRALIDELLQTDPSHALDVGCGTGKVARALMERGVPVLGIEPDGRMAEIARRHHVSVEVASFESWDPGGRTFDLVTAGHSWHWVDPSIGVGKAASIMTPGGTIALFWNYHVVRLPLLADFEAVYRAQAPELTVVGRDPSGSHDADPFEGCAEFRSLGSATYRWSRAVNADEWNSMLATFSDHARLEGARLRGLQAALRRVIERAGGRVRSECGTYVWTARRASKQ